VGLTLESAIIARRRRQAVGLSDTPGLLVAAVEPASPADTAGLARGDLIVEADGQPSISAVALAELLAALPDDKPLRVTLLRGNESRRAAIARSTKSSPNR